MIFFKIFRYDIKNGITKAYKKYILAFVFFISAALIFRMSVESGVPTLGDYTLFIMTGIAPYTPSPLVRFEFPIVWVCFFMIIFFIVLYYPYDDIDGFGKYILISSKKRSFWYLSKCLWVVFSVILYFALFMLSNLIVGVIFGDSLKPGLSEIGLESIYTDVANESVAAPIGAETALEGAYNGGTVTPNCLVELYLNPFLVCVATSLIQTTFSLFVKPVFSYILSAAILIFSAYYTSPFMIGNYAMVSRSALFAADGVKGTTGIIICVAAAVLACVVGVLRFRNYDIIGRDEMT